MHALLLEGPLRPTRSLRVLPSTPLLPAPCCRAGSCPPAAAWCRPPESAAAHCPGGSRWHHPLVACRHRACCSPSIRCDSTALHGGEAQLTLVKARPAAVDPPDTGQLAQLFFLSFSLWARPPARPHRGQRLSLQLPPGPLGDPPHHPWPSLAAPRKHCHVHSMQWDHTCEVGNKGRKSRVINPPGFLPTRCCCPLLQGLHLHSTVWQQAREVE
jgi:hypothetical protein